jgi:hypothetical protein
VPQDDRTILSLLVLVRIKAVPSGRANPDYIKETRRHQESLDCLGFACASHVKAAEPKRCDVFEGSGLGAEVEEIGGREGTFGWSAAGRCLFYEDQVIERWKVIRVEQERADNAEDGAAGSDSDCEAQDNDAGKTGCPGKSAEAVAEVADQSFNGAAGAQVAAVFPGLLNTAKISESGSSCVSHV